jgi:1,6-anhydro-N-acetylmuramate kinase
MDSPTFVNLVAELSGVDKEIAERVERVDGLLTGTRLDDLLDAARAATSRDCASLRHHGRERTTDQTAADLDISPQQARALQRTALQRLRELSSLAELEQAA